MSSLGLVCEKLLLWFDDYCIGVCMLLWLLRWMLLFILSLLL